MLAVAEFWVIKTWRIHAYIQLEKSLFKKLPNDMLITRIACNTEEACSFIEIGFEYVTGEYDNGGKIFRKRK
jgi:hypothetical protein